MRKVWLRWAGSKVRSLENLRPVFNRYTYSLYVEPFVGSGSVFFALNRAAHAILSDANDDLISFFDHLRTDPRRLQRGLDCFPRTVSPRTYYQTREKFNGTAPGFLRSVRFFFLNRLCFNGLYRVNKFGEFNVPIGSRRKFSVPAFEHLFQMATALRFATLRAADFEGSRRYARPGSLFYIDPPYTSEASRQSFDRYLWPPFRETMLLKLARYLDDVAKKGSAVIVSYAGERRPSFVPQYFHVKTFRVYRSISVNGARADYPEIIAYYP
jgi:DNA adenine methylase